MVRRVSTAVPLLLAVLLTAYGAVLRLDALVQRYGTVDRPAWASVLTHRAPPLGQCMRPSAYRWPPATPYVGGDPINYLKYAREMRSFYQAHVREPMFLALTRGFLWLLSNQDAAVSFASITGSTLTIFAAYLLGTALLSRRSGLLLALVVAADYDLISWSVEGWRDDLFMATVVLSAWALVRCRRDPSRARGAWLGVTTAAACLTRITALSFVLPGLVWLVLDGSAVARRRLPTAAAVAAVVLTGLVSPYLINCALATGDPFYAIDYHTGFYRFGEGLPSTQPMSAAAYVSSKVGARPLAALDTALTGICVQPFVIKWTGLEAWGHGAGRALSWLAIVGLLMWPFTGDGRMLLVLLFGSLLPYAFTWNVPGGGEWRFTMHAYPFYVLAALSAVQWTWHGAAALWRAPRRIGTFVRAAVFRRVLAGAVIAAVAAATYQVLPWFVVREAIARGSDVSIETGSRDRPFFGAGWSAPYADGQTFRVSRAERSIVRLPLPSRRTYQVVLRLDPVDPGRQRRAVVLLNRQLLAVLLLTWNPGRVGAYPLQLPADRVRIGSNELTIVPDTLVPAASAGGRFAAADPRDRLGVRLWYVRVLAPAVASPAKAR